jgi:hypothetical protein
MESDVEYQDQDAIGNTQDTIGNQSQARDYRVLDMNAAAYMVAQGIDLQRVEPGRGWMYDFLFADTPEVRAAERAYFMGELVSGRDFASALRALRAMVQAQRGGR